jgi:hypothetical protein
MRLTAVLCSVLVASGAVAALADVYRWVDASGSVHYSDVPVEGAVLIKGISRTIPQSQRSDANPTSYAAAARDRAAGTDGAIHDRLAQEDTARAVQDDVAKKRLEQCTAATKHYEQTVASRRLYRKGANGERVYLTDAEIDQARVVARTERDSSCGSPKR